MLVAEPFWRYALATVPPEPEAAPFLEAMRRLDVRPYRVISHETEDGFSFNASFFESADNMNAWLAWLAENALSPEGDFHGAIAAAAKDTTLPTPATLVYGTGTQLIADTRFGEYQLGMAVRYSRQVLRDAAMLEEACEEASSAEFEQRIAYHMQENNVAYFGRLIMVDHTAEDRPRNNGPAGSFLTAARYGSLDDARCVESCSCPNHTRQSTRALSPPAHILDVTWWSHGRRRGTQLVRQLMAPELERWFMEQTAIIGTAQRVMEL